VTAITGLQIRADYDVAHWVMIAPEQVMSAPAWAEQAVRSWAADRSFDPDAARSELLRDMLVEHSRLSREHGADIGFVHLRLDLANPTLGADLFYFEATADEEPDLATMLVGGSDGLIRPVVTTEVDVGAGPAGCEAVRYVSDVGGSVFVQYRLGWQAHPRAQLLLAAGESDLPRLDLAIDDLRDLARAIWLEPIEEQL
jgi:hypothetical protein